MQSEPNVQPLLFQCYKNLYQLKKEKKKKNYYTSNLQKILWIVMFLHNLLGNFIEAAFQFLRSFHKANKINWC